MSKFTAFRPEASNRELESMCRELERLVLMLMETEPLSRTHTHARKAPLIIDGIARDVEVGEPAFEMLYSDNEEVYFE